LDELHSGIIPWVTISQAEVHQGINCVNGVPQNNACPLSIIGANKTKGKNACRRYKYQDLWMAIQMKILANSLMRISISWNLNGIRQLSIMKELLLMLTNYWACLEK
jgi:hypothetical protein